MSAYLVTYDLASEAARDDVVREIKSWPWAKLTEAAYVVDTVETVQTIYRQLSGFLGRDDVIYIVALRQPFSGFGPDNVNDWLQKHLPR
jgi:hypothetical protein